MSSKLKLPWKYAGDSNYQEQGDDFGLLCNALIKAKIELKKWKSREAKIKNKLIEMIDGIPSKGAGYIFDKIVCKGSVDWSSISQLQDVDLEKYRNESFEKWQLFHEQDLPY